MTCGGGGGNDWKARMRDGSDRAAQIDPSFLLLC